MKMKINDTPQKRQLTNKEGMADMRRNRKNNIRRERIIMIASSAFVLAALTMTGVYMKEKNAESKNDGYTIDFAALEDNADDKYQEIAQNSQNGLQQETDAAQGSPVAGSTAGQANMDDDLDYMPLEAGSHLVEIPGLTDGSSLSQEDGAAGESDEPDDGDTTGKTSQENAEADDEDEDEEEDEEEEQTSSQNMVVSRDLHFSEENGLLRPVSGDILMHYSMDSSIYYATLDQYKYNPSVVFSASQGDVVSACAEGRVVNIFDTAEIGHAVTVELGDGYQATYGQLENIEVTTGSYVNSGDVIGSVAAPTKYYSLEGSNLYFQLTKDGAPVNPEGLF